MDVAVGRRTGALVVPSSRILLCAHGPYFTILETSESLQRANLNGNVGEKQLSLLALIYISERS